MKPIFLSLNPNVEKDDILLALKTLLKPWIWKKDCEFFEKELKTYLGAKFIFTFESGRSAFFAILKALELKPGDEVLVQAFTCNALVNPILWANLRPVFVDCEEDTLNLDIEDLEKKITSKSKVLVLQHTFGLPEKISDILKLAKKYKLILIEDCAHSLGAVFSGKKLGNFGKAAFFSFGRDKVISSVFGGAALTNDEKLAKKLRKIWEKCAMPSFLWILQQLLYSPLVEIFVKPHFRTFGKYLLFFFQKLNIISKSVTEEEKRGIPPPYFFKKFPRALAILAQNQLRKIEKMNFHREVLAKKYQQDFQNLNVKFQPNISGRIWLKFPLIFDCETENLLKFLEKDKIYLNDGWRKVPIVPPGTDLEKMGYKIGSCMRAEKIAKRILSLPTNIQISTKEAEIIIKKIKKFLNESFRNSK